MVSPIISEIAMTNILNGFSLTSVALLMSMTSLLMLVVDSFSKKKRISTRIQSELKQRIRSQVTNSKLFKDWSNSQTAINPELKLSIHDRIIRCIEQAGLQIQVTDLIKRSVILGLLFGSTILFHGRIEIAIGLTCLGLLFPWCHLIWLRKQRIQQLRIQLPETFEMIRRAVQSGQTIPNALNVIAKESSPPISDEFSYCCEQQSLGLPYETTLRDLGNRTGIIELQLFSVAMVLQRQAGGNPAEVLENLSDTVRKRMKLGMKVKAITGEGRMQALVLSLLPFLAFGGIYVLDPQYASVLFNYPKLLIGLAISIVVGILWIRRIVNFEY